MLQTSLNDIINNLLRKNLLNPLSNAKLIRKQIHKL